MAVGKNKRLTKGKKGTKKKIVDPMTRKDWYQIKAPIYFKHRDVGFTCVNRTQGTKIASDALKGRVFEVNLADLQGTESASSGDLSHLKVKLFSEDVVGQNVLLNFHGLSLTSDKLGSLVKKWQTLIEAVIEVKTSDGYTLRVFAVGFTKKAQNQVRKTTYAQTSQIRRIRKKMFEIIQKETESCDLKDFCKKLFAESIPKDIEKACTRIFPIQNVHFRKIKLLKKPKMDSQRMAEIHPASGEEAGAVVGGKSDATYVEPAPLASV